MRAPKQEFFLSEDDAIYVSAHGAEIDPVDDVFHTTRAIDPRKLKLDGVVQVWDNDIVPSYGPEALRFCYEAADMMATTLSDQNDPLGIIDPLGVSQRARGGTADNPLPVRTLNMTDTEHSQVAFSTEEVGASAELVENPPGGLHPKI